MSYVQLEIPDGYISRDIDLSETLRRNGYPSYRAIISKDKNAVRTLLYLEGDAIYLSEQKEFLLTREEDIWFFSGNPDTEPLLLSTIIQEKGCTIWEWEKEWKNMLNTNPLDNTLLWPLRTIDEAWDYIANKDFTIIFQSKEGRYICPIDLLGGMDRVFPLIPLATAHYATFGWRKGRYAEFRLRKEDNNYYLQFRSKGYADAEQLFTTSATIRENFYVKGWDIFDGRRWFLSETRDNALLFTPKQEGGDTFLISRLNGEEYKLSSGNFPVGLHRPFAQVNEGVEFNLTGEPIAISLQILNTAQVTNEDIYLLSNFVKVIEPVTRDEVFANTQLISQNIPPSPIVCGSEWDGRDLLCAPNDRPYTFPLGKAQCKTIEDFENDPHCSSWAIEYRGIERDNQMRNLCKDMKEGEYSSICGCYYSNGVYMDKIKRSYQKGGDEVAKAARFTNTLQCASGLCEPGSLSGRLYYDGSRKCDLCILVANVNISAKNINGDIITRQTCTQADITYDWEGFKLLLQQNIEEGQDPILFETNRILLRTNTKEGKAVLDTTEFLDTLPMDNLERAILTKEKYLSNPTSYTYATLSFVLKVREIDTNPINEIEGGWEQFLAELRENGGVDLRKATMKDPVLLDQERILLRANTPLLQEALRILPSLPSDLFGRKILTKELWLTDTVNYTDSVILFLDNVRDIST